MLLPYGVQVFLSTLWIWGLNSCTWACVLPCMPPPAAVVGTSSPLVSCPISQSHRDAPDTIEHLGWCWLSVCRPSSSALTRPNTEDSWQVSSLAMTFPLDFGCLLFFLTFWSWAGILLSSFCLDRAGGTVWTLVWEMSLCFSNSKTKQEDYLPMNFTLCFGSLCPSRL